LLNGETIETERDLEQSILQGNASLRGKSKTIALITHSNYRLLDLPANKW